MLNTKNIAIYYILGIRKDTTVYHLRPVIIKARFDISLETSCVRFSTKLLQIVQRVLKIK